MPLPPCGSSLGDLLRSAGRDTRHGGGAGAARPGGPPARELGHHGEAVLLVAGPAPHLEGERPRARPTFPGTTRAPAGAPLSRYPVGFFFPRRTVRRRRGCCRRPDSACGTPGGRGSAGSSSASSGGGGDFFPGVGSPPRSRPAGFRAGGRVGVRLRVVPARPRRCRCPAAGPAPDRGRPRRRCGAVLLPGECAPRAPCCRTCAPGLTCPEELMTTAVALSASFTHSSPSVADEQAQLPRLAGDLDRLG